MLSFQLATVQSETVQFECRFYLIVLISRYLIAHKVKPNRTQLLCAMDLISNVINSFMHWKSILSCLNINLNQSNGWIPQNSILKIHRNRANRRWMDFSVIRINMLRFARLVTVAELCQYGKIQIIFLRSFDTGTY